MTTGPDTRASLLARAWHWLKESAWYGGTLAAGLLGVSGLFADVISFCGRVAIIVIALALAISGVLGLRWRKRREASQARRASALETELQRIRHRLDATAPGMVLEVVGSALFVKPGAWRLTLFVLEQTADGNWCLKPLITRSSSEVFEKLAHTTFDLNESRLREILDNDANDPLQPFWNQSANLPSRDNEPEEWESLRAKLIPGVPDPSEMATRKFAWTAAKEPTSRRTVVLLSESVLPDGILVDVIRSQLLGPTISLIARMYGVAPIEAAPEQA